MRAFEGRGIGAVLLGAAAGAVGVWALDLVTTWLYDREDPVVRAREARARPGGEDPARRLAGTLAHLVGRDVEPSRLGPLATAVHYALGVLPGVAYALAARRFPALRLGRGLLYGLSLFLVQDELLNTVTGMAARPSAYPWQAHARGAAGHAAYGLALDASLRAAEAALARDDRPTLENGNGG